MFINAPSRFRRELMTFFWDLVDNLTRVGNKGRLLIQDFQYCSGLFIFPLVLQVTIFCVQFGGLHSAALRGVGIHKGKRPSEMVVYFEDNLSTPFSAHIYLFTVLTVSNIFTLFRKLNKMMRISYRD